MDLGMYRLQQKRIGKALGVIPNILAAVEASMEVAMKWFLDNNEVVID